MVSVTLIGRTLKLSIHAKSDKQKAYFRKIIKTIPGYKYVRSGDFYEVPLLELNSVITVLGKNRNFIGDKQVILDEYKKTVSEFKYYLNKYNPANFLKELDTNKEYSFLKMPPKQFQKLAIEWASTPKGVIGQYGGLIGDEVGLGKTFEAIASICKMKEDGICKSGIILCPPNMKLQWAEEISKFSNETFRIINSGKKDKRIKEYKAFEETFLIIGYELYRNDAADIQCLKKTNPNLDFSFIILDEAHKIKNINSKTYETISYINPKVKLLLTATPIKRDVDDLFALFNYIHPDILMGWNYFKNKFLYTKESFGKEIVVGGKKELEPLLHMFIAPYMIRRKSTDVSNEIPDLLEKFVGVEATKEQERWIKLFNDEVDKAISAARDAEKNHNQKLAELKERAFMSKFQALSVCSDHLKLLELSPAKQTQKLLEKNPIKDFTSPKLEWVLEFIEDKIISNNAFFGEHREKLIIFTQFERMSRILEEEINNKFNKGTNSANLKVMKFTGKIEKGCKRVTKDKLLTNCFECDRFNECESTEKSKFMFINDPSISILICTDAAQAGLNFQVAKFLINYDIPYSPGSVEQRNGRIKRIGSKHSQVIAYNLYTKGSLDEKIVNKLQNRRDSIDNIVESNEDEKEAYAQHLPTI